MNLTFVCGANVRPKEQKQDEEKEDGSEVHKLGESDGEMEWTFEVAGRWQRLD